MVEPDRPRVLHLRSSTDLSGPDRILLDLAAGLPDEGFEVHVGALSSRRRPAAPLVAAAREQGLDASLLPSRGPTDSRLVVRVARLIRRRRIALIHAHEPKGQLVGTAASRLTRTPLVVTHHGWLSRSRREEVYERVGIRAMARSAAVVAVGDAGARELAERGVPGAVVVSNGIRLRRLQPPASDARLSQLGVDPTRPLVIGCGRLEPAKGFAELLAAAGLAGRVRPLTVALLGEGPARGALGRRAARLGLTLAMPGHLDDAPAVMARAAVFVLASRKEGSPVALLEAMGQRCPVIATRVGDVPTLIADGEQGFLVDPGDTPAMARALATVLADPRRARALGEAARERIEASRDHRRMAARIAAVYRPLLSR